MAREKDYSRLLADWPYEYLHMKNLKERKKLLDYAIEQNIEPEKNEIRLMLWKRRYPDGEKLIAKGQDPVDSYIQAWMFLDFASDKNNTWFSRKKTIKEIKQYLDVLGVYAVEPYGELGEQILFEELYHLVWHYIQLCQDDRNYGSLILGLGKMSKEAYARKVAANLYRVCHKVANTFDMKNEFAILQKAAMEAYYDEFPEYQELYDSFVEDSIE